MSNYEKEMENEFEKFWDSDCHGWEKERCAEFNLSKISFETGANWQASRLTEEKILEIFKNWEMPFTTHRYGVSAFDFPAVAKEILALLKGENEK